jgi:hypothetical protein
LKTTSTVARILLGLLFLTFGLNGILQFIKLPPPTGTAAQFMGALFSSRELAIIMGLQAICVVLLLANRYVALALNLLGPVIVNIVLFHSFMAPSGLPLAAIATILWVGTAWSVRDAMSGILRVRTPD